MKRRDFLRATGVAAVALVMSGPLTEGSDDSQGAVKASLYPSGIEENADGQAGWAILNTNAQDELIVQIHLGQGLADTTYTVELSINGDVPQDVGALSTNEEGKGNAHVVLPVGPYTEDSDTDIEVQVFLEADE